MQTLNAIAVLWALLYSFSVGAMSILPDDSHISDDAYQGDVDSLAQGCFDIYSPISGGYLSMVEGSGLVNDGLSYRFLSRAEASSHFFFKPTGLGRFMLKDQHGRFLGTHLPGLISAGKTVGAFVEWRIEPSSRLGRFRLISTYFKRGLRGAPDSGKLSLSMLVNDKAFEHAFELIESDGCASFPEVSTSVTGDPDVLKGDIDAPVRGYIDPHTHITSYRFMGGRMMAGAPFSPWGVEHALRDSKDKHGKGGSLDIIGNLYTFGDLSKRYDTRGWPDFPWWPNRTQMSHMGYYYKWIERSWLSGLRIMVTNLVENEVLCRVQQSINPSGWIGDNPCETMGSIYRQIESLNALQDYVDAQAGGKGKGFFRIVTSPEQAREVIANGQMAVVVGIEASELFNCGLKDKPCTRRLVDEGLKRVHDLGVRSLFPTHKFNNQFGASPVEGGFINVGQWLSGGHFFKTEACDEGTQGVKMESGFPLIGKLPVLKDVLDLVHLNPVYDENLSHCNQEGLSELGAYLVNRMIDKGMLIELDHMSNKMATAVLNIAQKRQYSGVISSHSWMRKAKNGRLNHYNVRRLIGLGGFVAPYNGEAYDMEANIDDYLSEIEQTPYWQGVGVATDMSGLGPQAPPRRDAEQDPLRYPFVSEFGLVFDKQLSGHRVFDLNQDGVAHYGLLADHIQDIRERLPNRLYHAVMNSAEAYLQMWERSSHTSFTMHASPQ